MMSPATIPVNSSKDVAATSSTPPSTVDAYARERAKTAHQRGEDWAYTINHTIVCFTTDLLQVPLAAAAAASVRANYTWVGKSLNWLARSIGCGHLHYDANAPFGPQFKQQFKHWFKGEVYGDLGAVPLTLGAQYFFPSTMDAISHGAEKIVGPLFRHGAERSTQKWAKANGIAKDSAEYREHRDTLYQNEISHLGQGVVWTATSVPINFLVQLKEHRHDVAGHHSHSHGHGHASDHHHAHGKGNFRTFLFEFVTGKVFGTLLTLGMVLGLRTQFPETVRGWDRWTNNYLFTPMTHTINGITGHQPTPEETRQPTARSADKPDTKISSVTRDMPPNLQTSSSMQMTPAM